MATENIVALAVREIKGIDSQIARLRSVRSAWETIINAQKEQKELLPDLPAPVAPAVYDGPGLVESLAYGDKTGSMRKFMLAQNGSGVSKADLVAKAKTLTINANFPYRFISRMIESGEMTERNGRYFATDKMRQRIAEVA